MVAQPPAGYAAEPNRLRNGRVTPIAIGTKAFDTDERLVMTSLAPGDTSGRRRRRKVMRRSSAAALSVLALLTLSVAACGGDDDSGSAAASPSAAGGSVCQTDPGRGGLLAEACSKGKSAGTA